VDNLAAGNTNLSDELNNLTTDTNMLMGFLNDLKTAGLRTNCEFGAGMGTWQPSFTNYLSNFVELPLDILDVHVYPINNTVDSGDYLGRILTMADAAHAHGMKVGMGECWMQKERDSELSSNYSLTVYQGRDTYSFWEPLDEEFLLCMVKVGYYGQFDFIDPFWTGYYFGYLDFTNEAPKIAGLSTNAASSVLVSDETTGYYAALGAGDVTNTGLAYQEYILTNAPTLNFTARSNSLNLTWTPVAVNYLLEQSTNLSATNWTSLTIPARNVGADYSAAINTTNKKAFLRLHLP
jgi:hypothetical protein